MREEAKAYFTFTFLRLALMRVPAGTDTVLGSVGWAVVVVDSTVVDDGAVVCIVPVMGVVVVVVVGDVVV
jgi:hypothetical protein